MRDQIAPFPVADGPSLAEASRRVGRFLGATRAARRFDGLTSEELLLFLAIGHLSLEASGNLPRLVPRTYLEIAEFLHIPRETARRKLGRLCDRGLGRIVPGGVVVGDVAAWMRLAGSLLPAEAEATVPPGGRDA